jgi:poly(A) polymerase
LLHTRTREGAAAGAGTVVLTMVPERLQPLLDDTAPLARRFTAAGHRLYLVGGSVRDAIIGRPLDPTTGRPGDLDFTTDARPDDIEAVLRGWADAIWDQGRRFGTIGAKKDDVIYEITTHRAEAYTPDSRKPEVAFADAVEADLARRDFTVNAMALELEPASGDGAALIDPFGGLGDLVGHRLRTPLSPDESFTDDPLRMLRAARFVSGYGLMPEPALVDAVRRLRGRLEIVSPERIRGELDKLMVVEEPGEGLWFLVNTGLSDEFLPELRALSLEQDPIHRHKDVLAHTIAVVEKTSPDRILRLAALLHDIGKPKTRSIGPGGVSFHHHEVVGARMADTRLRALRYPMDDIADITRLVELHLRFHGFGTGWSDSAVRRYARDAGPLLEKLNELTRCDCTTRNKRRADELARRMDVLEERIAVLREQEELDSIRPDLDGNQIMEQLGIGPSRAVGQARDFLLELRLEEGPLGEDEARRRLAEWWKAQPPPNR